MQTPALDTYIVMNNYLGVIESTRLSMDTLDLSEMSRKEIIDKELEFIKEHSKTYGVDYRMVFRVDHRHLIYNLYTYDREYTLKHKYQRCCRFINKIFNFFD